ncbi:MAG: hypothetical protein ACXWQJ_18760, partial [Bdellovibrionota bacterium]
MTRRKSDVNISGNFTPSQLWIVLKANRRFCFGFALAGALFSLVTGLFEIPYYESYSKIQFKSFDMGKSVAQTMLQDADSLNMKEVMDRVVSLLRSDSFHEELATVIKNDRNKSNLVLAWAVGKRMRLQYAMRRLGLSTSEEPQIDLDSLSEEEVSALLGKMIDVFPDYKEQSELIKITGLEPVTVQKVNSFVATALMSASEKIKAAEIKRSIDYLERQKEAARVKMVEAGNNLRLFYSDNPELAGQATRSSPMEERSELQGEKEKVTEQLESNKKLLAFYRQKYLNFSKDSDTTAEVYNKFKQELIELKYKRKKFLFEGYDEKNEGILELDSKIANLEKILSASGSENAGIGEKHLVGIGHDQNLSEKILELQDSLKKQQFELESLTTRIKKITPQANGISKSILLMENLKTEARMANELFEELSKKCEYAKMRKGGDDQLMRQSESPSLPQGPVNIPTTLKVFFSFFVGLALAISWLIMNLIFTTKITDWQSVEDLGINFAGILHDFDPDLSEILMNLDCLDRDPGTETPIVLCTSPEQSIPYQDIQLLSGYLARQKEKSLFIIVGETEINRRFELVNDLDFAKVFAHQNGKEYLLQISDKNTIKALRESIKILEDSYDLRYSCIFLYFVDGINNPNYHVGLKLASKVLLLGVPAKFSGGEYFKLIYGMKDLQH